MQKISPCLWFDNNAEEAVKFYRSIFKKSKVVRTSHYGKGAPMPEGTLLSIHFQLNGQDFIAINGGPMFKFSEAISLSVDCKDQKEVDYYWEKLISGGGQESQCGWLKDKFGLSWQVVPSELPKMIADKNKAKVARLWDAVMKMVKLDIAELKRAFNGK